MGSIESKDIDVVKDEIELFAVLVISGVSVGIGLIAYTRRRTDILCIVSCNGSPLNHAYFLMISLAFGKPRYHKPMICRHDGNLSS